MLTPSTWMEYESM